MPKALLPFVVFLLANSTATDGAEPTQHLTFERDIRPIFRAHCFDCHGGGEEVEGGLDLRLVRWMVKGGESGPAIEPNSAKASLLLQRVQRGEMPPGDHRVSSSQIATIESWIATGAKTARPEPTSIGPGLGLTPEEREYWAFQPIIQTDVPTATASDRVRTPIDAFLLSRMEQDGLSFADDADRVTLIRRAYLDLIGLPPTPEQVEAFVSDRRSQAWEIAVDELLDSPHYGERWARHWLDVVGYADSEGGTRDEIRPWAYKYRDWVIRALNQDMPFDQFIMLQLAGDELTERPFKNMSPVRIDQLTATGFLRMAADGTQSKNDEETRNQVMADTIKIVSSSLLGLSVGCAQCHDHRYDPISQIDYFRMRAVFEPAINYQQWAQPSGRRVSLYTDEDLAKARAVEEQAAAVVAERSAKQDEYMAAALNAELAKFDRSIRQPLEKAYRTPGNERTDEQKALLEDHPSVAKLHPGVLYQYNQTHADQLKELDKQITEIRAKKPLEEFLRVLTEPAAASLPVTKLFHRGDFRQPRFEVKPGGMDVTGPEARHIEIPENDTTIPTSGRRLAYARWLTSGSHPLVARVLVNRFWLHHFGRTFVATPDEFGRLGSMPTHPELLDWLAYRFMEDGWSLKQLHRMIMTSTVYRQKSTTSTKSRQVDGQNALFSHFPVHRLEAEILRDSMLAISSRLDKNQFGPAVAVSADDAGQIIAKGDRQRRSIYLQVRRTQPLALLQAFDTPVMEVNCGKRESSTVATQALMLINGDFVLQCAEKFAEKLLSGTLNETDAQLTTAWQMTYSRMPTTDELQLSRRFLEEQLAILKARQHDNPSKQALINYAQALLTSNEFLYVE